MLMICCRRGGRIGTLGLVLSASNLLRCRDTGGLGRMASVCSDGFVRVFLVAVVFVALLVGQLNAASSALVMDTYSTPTALPSQSSPFRTEQLPDIPAAAPLSRMLPRHRRHHALRRSHIPTPSPGCGHTCLDPLTPRIESPCVCVHPMKVRVLLTVPVHHVMSKIRELAHEIAAGTHLIPSQVQVVGASIDTRDPERTVVDIDLVPLVKEFGTTNARQIAHRFLRGEVPLHKVLFGNCEVVSIVFPGFTYPVSFGPVGPPGATSKKHKMSTRAVPNIVLHSFIACLACSAAVYITMRCWRPRKESNVVGPVLAPPVTRKTGTGSASSSSAASSTSLLQLTSMHTSAHSMRTFSLAELEKATEKFNSKRMLGAGGFGKVYHGSLEDGTEVAVKLLTRDVRSGDREFLAEVMMLSRLHHRNLVKLIGVCIERHRRCLVYELVHNGNLDSHLHGSDKERRTLDWTERMKIAIGAARGLAYLHEDSNPCVIHRDFKSSNVLLEDDFTPKVSDFGLAREATDGSRHVSTRVMGTFGYVAPEYAMTGHLLVKSDVYSYGVVLLELLSGRKPVDMSQPDGDENLVTWARPLLTTKQGIQKLIDPSLSCNFDDVSKVAAIAAACIHPDVSRRPFMGEVLQSLKLIYNDAGETCPDCTPRSAASSPGLDFRSGFVTMDFSGSGRLEAADHGPVSCSSFRVERTSFCLEPRNCSCPLTTVRSKPHYQRLRGAVSECGDLSRRNDAFWA